MANVLRIIRNAMARKVGYMLIAAIAAFLTSQCAHADDIPALKRWFYNDTYYTDPATVCAAYISHKNATDTDGITYTGTGNSMSGINVVCGVQIIVGTYTGNTTQTMFGDYYCVPADAFRNGNPPTCSVPACPAGQTRNAQGVCEPPPEDCKAGFIAIKIVGEGTPTSVWCDGQCFVYYNIRGLLLSTDGGSYVADLMDSGVKCGQNDPDPVISPKPKPEPCPVCDCLKQGMSYGTVNGATVCVPKSTPGAPPTSNTPPPKVSTPAPTPQNPNPTPVITPEPTVTVTPPPAGSPAGTKPTVEEKDADGKTTSEGLDGYCKKNPTSSTCKEADKGSFGGSCDAGWSCEGDAAMCALAKRVHVSRCEDMKKNDTTLLGEAAMAGTSETPDDPRLDSNTKVIEVGEFNTSSGSLPDGGCISDKSISVGGHSITIPLSQVCPYLGMLGNGIIALAWLASAMIVTGNRAGRA